MRNDALTLYYFVTCLNGIAELTDTLLPYSGNLALAVVVQGIQTVNWYCYLAAYCPKMPLASQTDTLYFLEMILSCFKQ